MLLTSPFGTGDAAPRTADCCSRSAQILSNDGTSTHRPKHCSHSRTVVEPIDTAGISLRQRGQFRFGNSAICRTAAGAPQRGQCLLPRNINPKHAAQAIVARRASQYLQFGSSVDVAAPHIGQLSVSAFIVELFQDRWLRSFGRQTLTTRRFEPGIKNEPAAQSTSSWTLR